MLALAEARADAIVTSGRNLRHEPQLVHAIDGPHAADLPEWRRHQLGRTEPPWTAVLSAGERVDLDHPIFRRWTRPMIFCTSANAARLAEAAAARGIEVVGRERPSLASLLEHLRVERGCRTLLLEVGPSTAAEMYPERPGVDELLLSVCSAERVEEAAKGEPFIPIEQLAAAGLELVSEVEREEESGLWLFQRYCRREGSG